MRPAVVLVLLISAACSAHSRKSRKTDDHHAPGSVVLNGVKTSVVWSDGDSFRIKEGAYEGKGTRLVGYNTLEAFGPVHRWGTWTPQELFELAKDASQVAAAKEWTCSTDGKEDGYHRLLVDCPDLAAEMARQGVGMAYFVDGAKVDDKVLAAQAEAMKAGRGMWKKGVVKGVVSSVHSLDERGGNGSEAYNRVVDTRTGRAVKRPHHSTYETCQEVCETTDGDVSCMVYVPFEIRYRKKPECLK
jgi:endonuclease YncB( thermonuclease family)